MHSALFNHLLTGVVFLFVDSDYWKWNKIYMDAVLELVEDSTGNTSKNKGIAYRIEKGKANLRKWKPGESGNPSGRPKSADLREVVLADFRKNPLANILQLKEERIDLYFAYGFGKPVDRLELSGPNGGQIEVHQTSAEDSVKALAAMGIVLPG